MTDLSQEEMEAIARQGFIDRAKPDPVEDDEEILVDSDVVPSKSKRQVMPIEELLARVPR